MPKIYFLGNSHAVKIFNAAQNSEEFKKLNFELCNLAKPGGLVKDLLRLRYLSFEENDILCVQTMGNDILEKDFSKIKVKSNITFHLNSYNEVSKQKLQDSFNDLLKFLDSFHDQNVFFIDNPYRFITSCCKQHKIPTRSKHYQEKTNQKLREFLAKNLKSEKVFILDHRQLLGVKRKKFRNKFFYASLLKDNVHFSSSVYRNIAQRLAKEIKKKQIA